jgi:fucokinase
MKPSWHYLVVTAANDAQAAAYEAQIRHRRAQGLLAFAGEVLVVPDTGGRRIGSGGSTINCLRLILSREQAANAAALNAEQIFRKLRILIVHAGGDSRRLPAYSHCGKIFVPLPGECGSAAAPAIFDRLVDLFFRLPPNPDASGQIVVTSGDALVSFDPSAVDLYRPGITALASSASPEEASRHGVFCPGESGAVRLYLQKAGIAEQESAGAIGLDGCSMLDIGVMCFSPVAAAALLRAFCQEGAACQWKPHLERLVLAHGLDLYREICCALGTKATLAHYLAGAQGSGSNWSGADLEPLFPALNSIPLHLHPLKECRFLHFGSTRQLISSGLCWITQDTGMPPETSVLTINTAVAAGGGIAGREAWVEACRVLAPLSLGGRNAVIGAVIKEPLELPQGACLDIARGSDRNGKRAWFIRCYGIDDSFKRSVGAGATFNGMPLAAWLEAAGCAAGDVWGADMPENERTLWNARVFPAERNSGGYRQWLWMYNPLRARPEQINAFHNADRYSAAEIAVLADQDHYYQLRESILASRALPAMAQGDVSQ